VYIPRTPGKARVLSQMQKRSPNIIVIEDDLSVRKAVVRLLDVGGFPALGFDSAEAFLESPASEHFDCLILDVNLPGLSGLELYDRLKSCRRTPLPAIFVTAHDGSAAVKRNRDDAIICLSKPFDARTLLGAVRKLLAEASRK
jgi:two-component system response regulator DctR